MVGQIVRDTAQEREPIRAASQFGQMFADINTCHVCFYRAKFAAIFCGSLRLQIERILMSWSTLEKNQDSRPLRGGLLSVVGSAKILAKSKATAQGTKLNELPTSQCIRLRNSHFGRLRIHQ
jgi:hypothetical protein